MDKPDPQHPQDSESLESTDSDSIHVQVLSSIDEAPADQWDALVRENYPFLKTAFLRAMETHHCVGEEVGWIPRHLCYFDESKLLAALPLYEKHNSWGEFVFDHAWADAYQRHGLDYYPKLVNAIPFTPATGQRMLISAKQNTPEHEHLSRTLITAAATYVEQGQFSGAHSLFPDRLDFDLMKSTRSVIRNDCQFHWSNPGYKNFDEFLDTLRSKKKKNIRQERRKVKESGIQIRWLNGHQATEKDWCEFTRVYRKTYDRKYGMPAFNEDFFIEIAHSLPDQIQLALAEYQGQILAGALMYCDDTTLYGRHWGCDQYLDSLHFELCYYQGIEFCIRQGLKRFDPGAQGEHKVSRGFLPTRTQSVHWMAKSPFNQAIADFVQQEQQGVQRYIDAVKQHSPYNAPV
jgi:predicted N-acyltransferase